MSTPAIPFKLDVDSAKKGGYSDDEILQHLGETKKFNVAAALKDGYSKQELINHLSGFEPQLDPSHGRDTTDHVINFLRPLLSGGAAALAAPTSALTAGVPVGPVAAYTGMDALLQHLQSKPPEGVVSQSTGMAPGGVLSTLTNTAEQYGTGKLLEAGGKVIKGGISAFRDADQPGIYKLEPTTSQAMKSEGFNKLAAVSKGLEDLNKRSKNAALDRTAGRGFSEALEVAKNADLNYSRDPHFMLDMINNDMQGAIDPSKKMLGTMTGGVEPTFFNNLEALDKVIADPKKLKEVLARSGELGTGENLKKSLGGYQFMKIFNEATERDLTKNSTFTGGNAARINGEKLNEMWLDPKNQATLKELYNNQQRSDIKQFFTNVANTQDKLNISQFGGARRFTLYAGGAQLAHSLISGSLTSAATGAGTVGVFLGAQQLGKLLTNPKTARLMVALANGEGLGVSDTYASRAIVQALNGGIVSMVNSDGSKTPGEVRDGKFVPLQQ